MVPVYFESIEHLERAMLRSPHELPAQSTREAGFSIVEGLIAAALLLVVIVGTIPLFTRSMLNNVQGDEGTRATAIAIDDIERLLSLPFDSLPMSLPVGDTTLTRNDALLLNANTWSDAGSIPSDDRARFLRMTTIRQYNVDDLLDDGTLGNPLPGGFTPSQVHLKVLDIEVANPRTVGSPPYRVRVVQAY